jgi:hypothetical protein
MMQNEHLSAQISELRWLVYELGREMQALSTTPYPHVHRFLVHTLAKKVAQVAEAACESVSTTTHPQPRCASRSATHKAVSRAEEV